MPVAIIALLLAFILIQHQRLIALEKAYKNETARVLCNNLIVSAMFDHNKNFDEIAYNLHVTKSELLAMLRCCYDADITRKITPQLLELINSWNKQTDSL